MSPSAGNAQKQSHNHSNALMLILAKDASCAIGLCYSWPNTTDDFHSHKMCHFPSENLVPKSVCRDWCTIKDGTANLDSWHQLWMWLLHELQGAFCDRSNVCQTEAAMIRICVWVMLKGSLLTPERFSGAAVATQPNFILALFWEKEQLLCWWEVDLTCMCVLLYQYGDIKMGNLMRTSRRSKHL